MALSLLPHRRQLSCFVGCCFLCVLGIAPAGGAPSPPNAGGTIVLHAEPSIVYSAGAEGYCGNSGLTSCELATTRVPADPAVTTVFYVLAAFPVAAHPRLAGVTFGIDYDLDRFVLLDGDDCGDYELSESDWPQPVSGTAVTWAVTQTTTLVEVYWFAGYAQFADLPTRFELIPHPTQGGYFAHDKVAGNLDPIAGYGALGFGTDGYLPCPDGMVAAVEESWGALKVRYR